MIILCWLILFRRFFELKAKVYAISIWLLWMALATILRLWFEIDIRLTFERLLWIWLIVWLLLCICILILRLGLPKSKCYWFELCLLIALRWLGEAGLAEERVCSLALLPAWLSGLGLSCPKRLRRRLILRCVRIGREGECGFSSSRGAGSSEEWVGSRRGLLLIWLLLRARQPGLL